MPELSLGFSDCMGPKLRNFVEGQLISDLSVYVPEIYMVSLETVSFNWSDSCVEGHRTSYLDGELENFSGIAVYDLSGDFIAGGWMEFIETGDSLKVFWWYLDSGEKIKIHEKREGGIPSHVWSVLDSNAKLEWMHHSPFRSKLP